MFLVHTNHQKIDIYIIKALKASYHMTCYLVRRNRDFLWSPQPIVTQDD